MSHVPSEIRHALHDPDSTVVYGLDFSNELWTGEQFDTVTWSISPVEVGGMEASGSVITQDKQTGQAFSGGIVGHTYRLTANVTSDDGHIYERSLTARVGHK